MAFENSQTEIDPEAAVSVSPQVGGPARFVPEATTPLPTSSPSRTSVMPEEDSFIGSVLVGRYFIEKKLGQGGMGAVYLGRDRRLLDKPIVVKILLGEFAANDWVIRKFLQEKEALTRANHPGIVGILDAGELPGGKPFIVMEFIDGITLEEAITPKGMPLQRSAHLIKQIGSALAAAHDKGIYHRDLKPANIMLQSLNTEEQVRIIDFGIAKVHDSLVSDNTVAGRFGTYLYMSPEQFRVEEITAASDIYALGAIAYEMVTGRPPLDPEEFTNLGDMYSAGVKVLPKHLRRDLPVRAEKLILKALEVRPKDRFQSALEFGDALAQSLVSDSHNRLRPASWDRIARLVRGQAHYLRLGVPVVVAFMVLALVVVASLVALAFWPTPLRRETRLPPERREAVVTTVPPAVSTEPESSLTYWLTVQKAKDKRSARNAFESSGEEPFESGDAFQLNVLAEKPGYLYVLNEGATDDGTMNFTIIYPTLVRGKGSARLDGGRTVQTARNTFGGRPGTEQFWMVWSAAPIVQLESALDKALKDKIGRLTDHTLATGVREFFASHHDSQSPPGEETLNHRTVIRAKSKLLVKLLELQHR